MLVPFIRANRAVAASIIYPSHPLEAVAISEVISVFGPFLNPNYFSKISGLILSFIYAPSYGYTILKVFIEKDKIYNQTEICCLLLFILTFGLEYIRY